MLRVLGRYVPKYGKKSARKGIKQSSSSESSWSVAEEDSVQSSYIESTMPRLHHDDYFEKRNQNDEQFGLSQEELDRLCVQRRRCSSCSSCSSSSESEDEEDYTKKLPDDPCSYMLKDIFGVVRRVSESEYEAVLKVRNSTLEAAVAVTHTAEKLRVATLRASENELLNAINEAEEALAALKGRVQTEVAKITKDQENQPPKRKKVRAGVRLLKRGKSSVAARGGRSKQSLRTP